MAEQQQQSDPISQFQALPPERQKALLGKMSQEQKNALSAGIQKKLAAKGTGDIKPPKAPAATPGIFEQSQKFFTERAAKMGEEAQHQMNLAVGPESRGKSGLSQLEHGALSYVPATAEVIDKLAAGLSDPKSALITAMMAHPVTRPMAMAYLATQSTAQLSGLTPGIKKGELSPENVQNAILGMAMTAGAAAGGEGAKDPVTAVREGVKNLPSLTKAATKPVVQRMLFDRAMKVQDSLQAASDRFRTHVSGRWQRLESTIDDAKPEGSIDVSGLRAGAQRAVEETIHTEQKIPATVSKIATEPEAPRVFGERLDPSNPAHKALYDRLVEEGAIPKTDNITFAEARQLRSALGRELYEGGKLSGEARAVGKRVYGDLTDAMRKVSAEHGLSGEFSDVNKLHAQYMDDWVDPKSPLTKATKGENPHEIMGPLSAAKSAEQSRRLMARYKEWGIDPGAISKEGVIFDRLKSGLPKQWPLNRWEVLADIPTGGLPSAIRAGFNLAERASALRQLRAPAEFSTTPSMGPGLTPLEESPMEQQIRNRGSLPSVSGGSGKAIESPTPSSNTPEGALRHAQAIQQAHKNLGSKASVRELLTEADRIEREMRGGATADKVMTVLRREGAPSFGTRGLAVSIERIREAPELKGVDSMELEKAIRQLQDSAKVDIHEASAPGEQGNIAGVSYR